MVSKGRCGAWTERTGVWWCGLWGGEAGGGGLGTDVGFISGWWAYWFRGCGGAAVLEVGCRDIAPEGNSDRDTMLLVSRTLQLTCCIEMPDLHCSMVC